MDIYLPIAALSVDVFVLLGLGGAVGFLSGVFGVGGGFLLTPLLIFIGMPPAVAVASSANQLVGASVSGVLAHWRRGNVDFHMGFVLLVGGFAGSGLGVWLFALLRRLGQVELVISLCYVVLLGVLGSADAGREHAGHPAPAPAGRRAAQAASAHLAARPAAQDALPPLQALYQRARAGGARASSSASCRRSWASAAASSWCRR